MPDRTQVSDCWNSNNAVQPVSVLSMDNLESQPQPSAGEGMQTTLAGPITFERGLVLNNLNTTSIPDSSRFYNYNKMPGDISEDDNQDAQSDPASAARSASKNSKRAKRDRIRGRLSDSSAESQLFNQHQVKQLQHQIQRMSDDHASMIKSLQTQFDKQLEFLKTESAEAQKRTTQIVVQLKSIIMATLGDDPRAKKIGEAFDAFHSAPIGLPPNANTQPRFAIHTENQFQLLADNNSTSVSGTQTRSSSKQRKKIVAAQKALKIELEAQNNPKVTPTVPDLQSMTDKVKKQKVPQIVVLLEKDGQLKNGETLANVLKPLQNAKYKQARTSKGYRLFPDDIESHGLIVKALADGAQHYTHDQKSDKLFKRVLKGLDRLDPNEVKTVIGETTKVTPSMVTTLGRGSALSGQLYLVTWPSGTMNSAQLENHRYLGHYKVKWETPRKREPGPTQCTRCTRFGHGQKNCSCSPICLFCAEDHMFNTCVCSSADEVVRAPLLKCYNCMQIDGRSHNHAANDKKCLTRAEAMLRRSATPTTQPNIKQQERSPRTFKSPKFTSGSPSFSEIVQGNGVNTPPNSNSQSKSNTSTRDLLIKMQNFTLALDHAKSDNERNMLAIQFMLNNCE